MAVRIVAALRSASVSACREQRLDSTSRDIKRSSSTLNARFSDSGGWAGGGGWSSWSSWSSWSWGWGAEDDEDDEVDEDEDEDEEEEEEAEEEEEDEEEDVAAGRDRGRGHEDDKGEAAGGGEGTCACARRPLAPRWVGKSAVIVEGSALGANLASCTSTGTTPGWFRQVSRPNVTNWPKSGSKSASIRYGTSPASSGLGLDSGLEGLGSESESESVSESGSESGSLRKGAYCTSACANNHLVKRLLNSSCRLAAGPCDPGSLLSERMALRATSPASAHATHSKSCCVSSGGSEFSATMGTESEDR